MVGGMAESCSRRRELIPASSCASDASAYTVGAADAAPLLRSKARALDPESSYASGASAYAVTEPLRSNAVENESSCASLKLSLAQAAGAALKARAKMTAFLMLRIVFSWPVLPVSWFSTTRKQAGCQ